MKQRMDLPASTAQDHIQIKTNRSGSYIVFKNYTFLKYIKPHRNGSNWEFNFRRMPCTVGKEPENCCKLEQIGYTTKHTPEQGCMCGFVMWLLRLKITLLE